MGADPGTVATFGDDVRVTAPVAGAGPLKVTVPVALWPISTGFGENVRLMICGGGITSQNHRSKSPPGRPSPLGRRKLVRAPLVSCRLIPKASPSRYRDGSCCPQMYCPLRLRRVRTRVTGTCVFVRMVDRYCMM